MDLLDTMNGQHRDQTGPKILLVGDFIWPWYQEACAKALEASNCEVIRFGWVDDFWRRTGDHSEPEYKSLYHRVECRFLLGPTVAEVNWRLIKVAQQEKPDIIWLYNVQIISAATIKKMRKCLPNSIFCQYANDNPFSKDSKLNFWRKYIESIKHFDIHFSFRHQNIDDYHRYGAKDVSLLRAYFIPEADYPVSQEEIPERFKCDVVFAGHYENDGRVEMLEAICDAGFDLRIYGGAGWNAAIPVLRTQSPLLKYFPVNPALGVEYRYAICGAKVALCFLSTHNQDTYTRRNFQIPAMKVAMLSQYTKDLATLFKPDVEALFFRDAAELVSQLYLLISNQNLRAAIAEAGYRRVYEDCHDVYSRMHRMISQVLQWTENNSKNVC